MFSGACNATYQCQDYKYPQVTCLQGQCVQCAATEYPSGGSCGMLAKLCQYILIIQRSIRIFFFIYIVSKMLTVF